MMRRAMVILLGSMVPAVAGAQTTPTPVGPSVSSPTYPTGKTPPGAASAATPSGRIARDTAGQKVIGHTTTTGGGTPGNTGGAGTGAK